MARTRRATGKTSSRLVTGVLACVFLLVLLVAGIANARGGNDAAGERPAEGVETVPVTVRDGGPIVDATRGQVTSTDLPRGTIALTFDDGPDPTWTPAVLAVLEKHHVPATFFVVGANVTRHPELVADIHAAGSELGVHSFSHPDLGTMPRWRVDRELAETQLAVAGAAGVTTFLLRPPYSSRADAVDGPGYATVLAAGQDGYVTVFTTDDSEDWQRPGVDAIVRNATPKPDAEAGSIVLMHDAGGDRAETVAALDRYIPLMQAKGYRFTTVSGGAPNVVGETAAEPRDRFNGSVLVATLTVATTVVTWLGYVLLIVGALVGLRLVFMLVYARRHARRRRRPDFRWGPPVTDPVSVIVPAYNEIKNIEATVRSILANDHPLEVLVVDDGSTDGTAERIESLELPGVRVMRQRNSGKPKALNAGIRAARHEIIIMIDGDTVFESDTVRLLAQPFADPAIGAVAGNVKIANRDELIGRMQHIEYVVGFNIDRRVQDETGSIATVPGAGGAFRRTALLEVGGLSTDTLAEDTDLTIALGRAGWRVVFEEHARAWTEAPATMAQLYRQRYRWSYGTMQAMWKHRRALRERGAAGKVGRRGLAQVAAFQILLPLTAPLVDVFFVFGLLFADPALTLLLGAGMLGVQLIGALYAFRLEGEAADVLWVFPAQQIVYRQLMYTVLIRSVASAVSGVRVRWQRMNRIGALGSLLAGGAKPPPVVDDRTMTGMLRGVAASSRKKRGRRSAGKSAPAPVEFRRERWLDLLRVAALARVIATTVGTAAWVYWLPAFGVLFAVGGSLMARSSRLAPEIDVVGHRLRRLLVPLWVFGLVAVPTMLWFGWGTQTDQNSFYLSNLVYWLFPFLDPPGSTAALPVVGGLWYVRACLWFVLCTPLMRAALRRSPPVAMTVPLLVVGLDAGLGWNLATGGGGGPALIDFCTFATCWMLGMAHRDGLLRRLHPVVLGFVALVVVAVGVAWMRWRAPQLSLDEVPLGQALVAAGVVLVLLGVSPLMAWLDRVPLLGGLLTVVTGRTLTIYLCFPAALLAVPPVAARLGLDARHPLVGSLTAVGLVLIAVLLLGWVEDVAARRRPRLLPSPRWSAPSAAERRGSRPSRFPTSLNRALAGPPPVRGAALAMAHPARRDGYPTSPPLRVEGPGTRPPLPFDGRASGPLPLRRSGPPPGSRPPGPPPARPVPPPRAPGPPPVRPFEHAPRPDPVPAQSGRPARGPGPGPRPGPQPGAQPRGDHGPGPASWPGGPPGSGPRPDHGPGPASWPAAPEERVEAWPPRAGSAEESGPWHAQNAVPAPRSGAQPPPRHRRPAGPPPAQPSGRPR